MSMIDKVSKLVPIVRIWRDYHKFCSVANCNFSLWRTT